MTKFSPPAKGAPKAAPDQRITPRARRIGFLLIDGYAILSAASAIDPLRAANQLSGARLYDLRFIAAGGGQGVASAGSRFDCVPLGEAGGSFDLVFVVAGGNPFAFDDGATLGWLRRLAARGVALGGISGGAAVLHRAGVLARRRFTIHWEHYEALREAAPEALLERRLFVIDRDRYTCAGGTAPLDMMHALIAADHGAALAQQVSDWFIHTAIRAQDDPQRRDEAAALGARTPPLAAAVALMATHLAAPLSLAALSRLAGVSPRRLTRLAQAELGAPPMQVYRRLRLEKADALLRQSALSVVEVGLATGFHNPTHFAAAFRAAFGMSPRARRAARGRPVPPALG